MLLTILESIVTPLQVFKHLFIPHEHNDYKPHIFREFSVALIIVVSLFLLGFSAGSSYLIRKTVLGANVTADVLIDLTNETRLAYNELPLTRNEKLDDAAVLKAEDMATNGYFAHTSPTGVTPWHWFRQAGYDFLYAGENLAINFTDAEAVRDAWLASPTHRENLLDIKFKEIGMAAVSGVYKDGPTVYVVQMFGTPVKAQTKPAETVAKQETPKVAIGLTQTEKASSSTSSGNTSTNASTSTSTEWWAEPAFSSKELVVATSSPAVEGANASRLKTYSTWYERALFGGTHYVDWILKLLLVLILASLITMLLIEVRRQHWKHIVYGLSLLLIISLSIILNQLFW